MPANKTEIITFFCSHCGETRTFRKDDERARARMCQACLQGEMVEVVHTMDHDAT